MASITYRIGGTYNGQAISQAQNGLSSLSDIAGKLKGAFVAVTAALAVKKIINFSNECTQAYGVQEEALNRLSQAVRNNNKLTQASFKSIVDYTGKLQGKSIYGDEILQGQAAYIASLGYEEKEIKKVLKAAVELSSAGVGDLDSNVKNLTKTLSGQKGKLGELIPEMKNLTEEQLKNGEALDIVASKYNGFAESLSQNTLKGVTAQFGNLVGDIKEKLGGIAGALKFEGMKGMLPILENINTFLEANADKITNLFLNLPEVATASFTFVKGILKRLFTIEGFVNFFKTVGKLGITILKNILLVLWNVVQAVGTTIWEPLKTGFEWIGYGIKAAFNAVINFFIQGINNVVGWFTDKINWAIEKINTVNEFLGKEKLIKIEKAPQIELLVKPEKPEKVDTQKITDSWKNVGTGIVDGVKETVGAYQKTTKDLGKQFNKEIGEFKNTVSDIMNRPVHKESSSDTGSSSASSTGEIIQQTNKSSSALTKFTGILKALGEVGEIVSLILESNPIGLIVMLITKFIAALTKACPEFEKFINGITEIMTVAAAIVAPLVSEIFSPLVSILHSIGEIVGAVLLPVFTVINEILTPFLDVLVILFDIITPIITVVSQLVSVFLKLTPIIKIFQVALELFANILKFLYTYIIKPVVNFLMTMVESVGNFFIRIWNKIVQVLKRINIFGWRPFGGLQEAAEIHFNRLGDLDDSKTKSSEEKKESSSRGASYTAAKDIYVNIYYNHSYVNGDAREIALQIRDEIKNAERLGR